LDRSGQTGDIYKARYNTATKSRVNHTLEVIEKLNQYCKDNKMELVVVVIPTIFQVYENVKESFIRKSNLDKNEFDFNKPQALLKDFFSRENIEFIDLFPELKKRSSNHDVYWRLNPHFNKKGNEIAAEIIYDQIKDFIPRKGDNTPL
jgi:SGNH hydrolase-like domain, acetyltransferase AlgX